MLIQKMNLLWWVWWMPYKLFILIFVEVCACSFILNELKVFEELLYYWWIVLIVLISIQYIKIHLLKFDLGDLDMVSLVDTRFMILLLPLIIYHFYNKLTNIELFLCYQMISLVIFLLAECLKTRIISLGNTISN